MTEQNLQLPAIEAGLASSEMETATLGMGCFWGPEAQFGALPGVIRTRVGYAGGTTEHPTYNQMGDHTETVEVDFDPRVLSYGEILRHFWRNHYPRRDDYMGRQYLSLLRYRGKEQEETVDRVKREMEAELGMTIETDIAPFSAFTLAEDYHQKYYLKRYPKAFEQLKDLMPHPSVLTNSTFAARLNGFVKGYGEKERLLDEISGWNIPADAKDTLKGKIQSMKW
ncbi:peptide-methionine (S)-S-oxide reductase [Tetzosporium hominis]|uniref:Peptide methionine sulfoxide reductase MsrA n=2 Tax=Tetzosporium hominis TaxID=2020506 RepID=A0A264W3N4_9BACL|nr:peptide-methionine (S)-S-oxide reductase MsrA [Tetzosporium hominis]MDN5708530.1 peptide-methionine (S)-S-oxide reductase MsrA [Planococcus sp. (in: firmicutes)]OZS78218.1 peptide-methionine (S)-S-oxide reductase [Tetzosporium hominis]